MILLDHRTGKHIQVGDTVEYSPGEGYKLLDVTDAVAWASAKIQRLDASEPELVTLDVRFDYPFYRLQRVAVIPDVAAVVPGGG